MKKILVMAAALLALSSCTEQMKVREFGGTMEVKLPKGEKLIMATWKETNLFYDKPALRACLFRDGVKTQTDASRY